MKYKMRVSVGKNSYWQDPLPYEWSGPSAEVEVTLEELTNLSFYEDLIKQMILKQPDKNTDDADRKKAYSIAKKTLQQGGEVGIIRSKADGDGSRTNKLYLDCKIFSAMELSGSKEEANSYEEKQFAINSKTFKVDISLPDINEVVAGELESQR